jgi:hypothetical protein
MLVLLLLAGLIGAGARLPRAIWPQDAPLLADGPSASSPRLLENNFKKLPLSFELNRGQADSLSEFVAHGRGLSLLVAPDQVSLALQRPMPATARSPQSPPPLPDFS